MEGYYTGFISSIDRKRGMVKVVYPQEGNLISDWLPLPTYVTTMPLPGEYVGTVLDKFGGGLCFGKIWSNKQVPPDRFYDI